MITMNDDDLTTKKESAEKSDINLQAEIEVAAAEFYRDIIADIEEEDRAALAGEEPRPIRPVARSQSVIRKP